jgi:putative flavoprotein involved in K+ transport
MNNTEQRQRFDTVVIGGGQAGLAVGYYLALQQRDFVILDANARIGASWRRRWDSLRLFTPAAISSLPGMPIPATADTFLAKDAVADYLEAYAATFKLPVRLNTAVEKLTREGDRYVLRTGDQVLEAEHVVVATGTYRQPYIPSFAAELDPAITQFHSDAYRNPDQLQPGPVLVVGAGNSGAEIALELAAAHTIWLAGRDPGHRPKNIPAVVRPLYWWLLHQALNAANPLGRRFKALSEQGGAPLLGIPRHAFEQAGIARVPRMSGVHDRMPQLDDGRVLSVANVIWCTGYVPNFHWIELPAFAAGGYPAHTRGTVQGEPGLYMLGLPFEYTLTSSFLGGVGRDARYIAAQIAAHSRRSTAELLAESTSAVS